MCINPGREVGVLKSCPLCTLGVVEGTGCFYMVHRLVILFDLFIKLVLSVSVTGNFCVLAGETTTVDEFLGVPYAAAPTGKRRFKVRKFKKLPILVIHSRSPIITN